MDPTKQMSDALAALMAMGDEHEEGTQRDHAQRLAIARDLKLRVQELIDGLEMLLIDNMESNSQHFDGVGWVIRRQKKDSTAGSDWEGARRAAKRAIVDKVSLDVASGEMRPDWKHVAEETADLMQVALSVGAPLQGFEKVLHLDQSEFIKRSPGGYSIEITDRV